MIIGRLYVKVNEYQLCSVLAGHKANDSLSWQQLLDHEILLAAEFQHTLQQPDLKTRKKKQKMTTQVNLRNTLELTRVKRN